MNEYRRIFLIRHGDYENQPERLTSLGRRQAENAAKFLVAQRVGHDATLLTSDARRALETARIIARNISPALDFIPSQRIAIVSNAPFIESLDEVLDAALEDAHVTDEPGDLLVVTHSPLLKIAAKGAVVDNGEVIEYELGSWRAQSVSNAMHNYLQRKLADAQLT